MSEPILDLSKARRDTSINYVVIIPDEVWAALEAQARAKVAEVEKKNDQTTQKLLEANAARHDVWADNDRLRNELGRYQAEIRRLTSENVAYSDVVDWDWSSGKGVPVPIYRKELEAAEAKLAAQADPLRTEHQRLKDAVVRVVLTPLPDPGVDPQEAFWPWVNAIIEARDALAAFEAQHPHLRTSIPEVQ